jgi:pimeloyl-ACP methyl ester carboxylesterase
VHTTVRSADGRVLDVEVDGPSEGDVLLLHHGTPGSALLFARFVEEAASRGMRLATYSRPGYGGSTRLPGRSVAQCVTDVEAVLDELGAGRAFVAGWSGGGPHALACAALIPGRVVAAASVAGVGAFAATGLDFLRGMAPDNVEEFEAAIGGPERLRAWMDANTEPFTRVSGDDVVAAFGELLAPVDRDALTGDLGAFVAASIREAIRAGYWGWFDDDLAFVREWEFELDSIAVPVAVWQGVHDRMVPFAHGRWLVERLPDARAHLEPEHGHLSLAVGEFGAIVDDLVDLARA